MVRRALCGTTWKNCLRSCWWKTKRGKVKLGSREVSSARDLELVVQEGLPSESVEITMNTSSRMTLLSLSNRPSLLSLVVWRTPFFSGGSEIQRGSSLRHGEGRLRGRSSLWWNFILCLMIAVLWSQSYRDWREEVESIFPGLLFEWRESFGSRSIQSTG